ncbi:PD-(D/E)XK nuclease superfamily protein [Hypnocyclicus thermotrophus]|uniref:PD-(D/E)XK nuclease superfamily protein n=1 Tax=Hypnocyclicus thermotrophus TaxID=1627895 RepID=A0AA46DX70_9FUSO|nr:AAA family ATPase [Hypnocyclicus thermotrophus]TDT67883.1 PD-(D/E)XK nuclease superfamily protein [Hypnocyclicus thermotrophus]
MKKIAYGISNFKTIIEDGYYYVDKTKYIEMLENLNERYLIFLRPRRFGKSLFISLLEYYYDINYKENKLFDEFYIGNNPTKLKNSYYILKFNFSGINTKIEKETLEGFRTKVINGIKEFLIKNKFKMKIDEEKTATEIMSTFLTEVRALIDGKIYILIDEYDHFANELLGFNYNFYQNSVSSNGFVRKFYEVIKDGTGTGIVDRLFITGVSPITLDSMTSGFNIGSDITLDSDFNEMMGFTEEEVKKLANATIENYDIDANIDRLRDYYNGYKFNKKCKNRVYNSDMVLYYMSYYQKNKEEPENIIDNNILSDYRKIGKLFEIGGRNNERIKILKEIVMGIEQEVVISSRFNLEIEFNLDDFKSLLFYMGLMTIKRVDEFGAVYIGVPNYVIRELYFEYFNKIIEEEADFKIDDSKIREAILEIARDGKIDKLIKLTENILHKLSNRDFIKFDEKYVKVIMLMYLYKSNLYFTKSEYEVEDGYIDIVLKKGTIGQPRYYGMFELKYISKKDYTEDLLKKKLEEAKEQLMKYKESEELRSMNNMKKWALVFVGSECKGMECISDNMKKDIM